MKYIFKCGLGLNWVLWLDFVLSVIFIKCVWQGCKNSFPKIINKCCLVGLRKQMMELCLVIQLHWIPSYEKWGVHGLDVLFCVMGFVLIVVVVVVVAAVVVVGGQQIQYLRKKEQWELLVMINRTWISLALSPALSPSLSLSHSHTHTGFFFLIFYSLFLSSQSESVAILSCDSPNSQCPSVFVSKNQTQAKNYDKKFVQI